MVTIIRAADGHTGIPAHFPILLTTGMEIIEPAFDYLHEIATLYGRTHSRETLRTYAEHLYDWFDSLEQSGISWREVRTETIAAYRNRMLEQPSAYTRRPYARSTINDRVRTICRFYEWAHAHGWIDERPVLYADLAITKRRRQGFLAHLGQRATVRANALTVAEFETLPRPLRIDELKHLFSHLDMPYRLMAEWALATGMRRMELCALAVEQVPDVCAIDAESVPLIGISLTATKGARPRAVYPPIRLIDRTHWYIGEDRAALVRMRTRRRSPYQPPANLFLNHYGNPVTRARLTAVLAAAFDAAAIKGSLHWLRHTFAMTMLVRLQAQAAVNPAINPLKVLQVLMGHSSIQTTSIYLRCVELHDREIAESLAYLYGEAIDGG
ncbi:integrase [Sphingobium jiangsuense]|uniref:Site-specific recombinase XerD n=1 Tax=Sphingobium jiangsuense TaxID=870476 RepID=A0A7W6FRI3_9SPHN|nr:tyrosine-type recombinase/integrase [Sphingobium jiangsuense]MBB3928050.1 site-specific recombinase XerD [Sphingobium jiangsuense]GLT00309.1 integrase [Sphingobium jiangsuense]